MQNLTDNSAEMFKFYLEYNMADIVSALRDELYFVSLISKMDHRVNWFKTLSEDIQNSRHLWFDESSLIQNDDVDSNNDSNAHPKAEFEDDEEKDNLSIDEIRHGLDGIENDISKKKYLGCLLYPKLVRLNYNRPVDIVSQLLQLDNLIIIRILTNQADLITRANEAVSSIEAIINMPLNYSRHTRSRSPMSNDSMPNSINNNNNYNSNNNNNNNYHSNNNSVSKKSKNDDRSNMNDKGPLVYDVIKKIG